MPGSHSTSGSMLSPSSVLTQQVTELSVAFGAYVSDINLEEIRIKLPRV